MSVEITMASVLKLLAPCFPDVAPEGAAAPYIVYQQVGGAAFNTLEAAAPAQRQARMQVACWAATRIAASDLARAAEASLITDAKAYAIGAFVSDHDETTKLYGARQDFYVHY